jgi:hypothetical protein
MSKNKDIIQPKEDSDTDDNLVIQREAIPKEKAQPKLTKSGKEKAPYVLTEARKKQFEIARNARMKNIESKKAQQNENYAQYDELKKELEKKKIKKLEKIKQKELVKLMAETDNISTDNESDDEDLVVKPKAQLTHGKKTKAQPKPKKKRVIVESSSEEEQEIISKANPREKHQPQQTPKPKSTIRYF